MCRINNWINEGSGWIVELSESQYINVSTYRPLSWGSYVKLPTELKSPKKELINIKNNNQKCFLWCHVRHNNPVMMLIMIESGFLCKKTILARLLKKKNICISMFCYESKLIFPIYIPDQKFENSMDLLIVTDGDKSHYVYIKDFDRLMFRKTKSKNKKYICKHCLQNMKKFV